MGFANSYTNRLYYISMKQFEDCQHHLIKWFLHNWTCNIVLLLSNSHWKCENYPFCSIGPTTQEFLLSKMSLVKSIGTLLFSGLNRYLASESVCIRQMHYTLWLQIPLYVSKNWTGWRYTEAEKPPLRIQPAIICNHTLKISYHRLHCTCYARMAYWKFLFLSITYLYITGILSVRGIKLWM